MSDKKSKTNTVTKDEEQRFQNTAALDDAKVEKVGGQINPADQGSPAADSATGSSNEGENRIREPEAR